MDEIDILIIGAGVVGLAVAKELAKKKKAIVVVERNKSFGQETSSRNSEVIHAGIYYPSDSLKAKLCVEGRKYLYELCQKNNIAYRKTGKFIVAVEEREIVELDRLFSQGRENGVEGLNLITQQDLKSSEPNIYGILALHSPETGIIDSHQLMQYFLYSTEDNGAIVAFNSEVIGIEKLSNSYKVSVKNNDDISLLQAQTVINCAGLDSDDIAHLAGIDIKKLKYELHYCKGQYFRVNANKAKLIKKLIYPVPKAKSAGLGVHATLDLAGGLRLGPDDNYLNNRIKDYSVDGVRRKEFYSSAKIFLPFLEENDLSPDISGIRPKLQDVGEDFRDFIIKEESDNGLPGFINLVGIESPGLTAAPAIAKMVMIIVQRYNL